MGSSDDQRKKRHRVISSPVPGGSSRRTLTPGEALVVDLEQDTNTDPYQSYLPRIVLHWDKDAPSSTHQAIVGTMVFVDISGFTALSERLAMLGKVGAEEVTEVLGGCFKGLLAVAYPLGGRLIKFGGDALLLLFNGEGHEHRAVNAAVGMQHAMKRLGKVKTPVGNMTLKMSIGVNSGEFNFFLVGKSHRELILTGSAATATVEMEAFADATEIVVSRTTAAGLPKSSVGDPKGAGFLIRKPVPEVAGGTVDVRPATGDLEQYIPVAVRQALVAGANEPEHRQVTVAFLQFMGVDSLLYEKGPEAVAHALSDLVARVQAAVDPRQVAFLGTDIYDDGGKIILAAGAPTATGNDSERMLHALREIIDHEYELPIKIGVNRGHVFAGDVGPLYRRTYTIMGDDVNLAARLMSAATPGTIYATPVVLENSRTLFATTALEPFPVKGKAEPVQAFAVGEETGTRSGRSRDELPFTGRVDELAQLCDALESACRGVGQVVALVGERGIGKTRLVQEAVDLQPDLPAATVRAEPYGTATPYRPFRDPARTILGVERADQETMARQMTEAVQRLDPELLPFLPLLGDVAHVEVESTPEVDAIDQRFRRERLADAVIRVLELALPGPQAIVIEEGQWMDAASTELAERLCRATEDHPWAVLTTRVSGEGRFEPDGTPTIELGPLATEEATSIVLAVTDDKPLLPHDVKAIVQRAGGNALFLEEILSVVKQSGSIRELPDSLDALVSAQIDALPPRSKRLLRYASVLGRSFRLTVLNEVLGDDNLRMDSETQDELLGFLVSNGPDRLRFRHGLLRDVAYEGLPYRRRRELHRRAAYATERLAGDDTESVADLLSLHFSLAQEYEPTWRYARVAGDDARDAYSNVDAAVQYSRAVDAARRLPEVTDRERVELLSALGDVELKAGRFKEALSAYRNALRFAADDPLEKADLLLRRARARERAGSFSVALRDITAGLKLVEHQDNSNGLAIRARLTALRATVRQAQDQPRPALRLAKQAVEQASAAGEEEALAKAYNIMNTAYHMLGRSDEAVFAEKSLALYEKLGMLDVQAEITGNLGAGAYFAGDWARALDYYAKAKDMAERAGNTLQAAITGSNMGEVFVNQGRMKEAEPLLQDSARVMRAAGFTDGAVFAEIHFARVLADRGQLDDAENLLRGAGKQLSELGRTGSALEAAIFLAECRLERGDPNDALEILTLAEKSAGRDRLWYSASLGRVRGQALSDLGRTSEAQAAIAAGLAAASDQGLGYEEALLVLTGDTIEGGVDSADPSTVLRATQLLHDLDVRRLPCTLAFLDYRAKNGSPLP